MSLFWTSRSLGGVSSYATSTAAQAQSTAREAEEAARSTDERLDQLLLVCAAMWELIREKTNLTEEDLLNRVAIIDARDGQADGKISQQPTKCPKCHRTVMAHHTRCLYCGYQLPVDSVFKTI